MIKSLANIIRTIVAILLILESIVKAIDPVGFSYIISNMLTFIGGKELAAIAKPLTIVLITLEFTLGIMLLFKFLLKTALNTIVVITFAYSLVTFFMAQKGYKSFCSCNMPFLLYNAWSIFIISFTGFLLAVTLRLLKKFYTPAQINEKYQLSWTLTAALIILTFEFINYTFLPIIDFTPYKIGVNLAKERQAQIIDKKFKVTLLYKNKQTGKIHKFTEDSFPWNDTIHWEWVETKVKEIHKGKTKRNYICDFQIINPLGKDITDSILSIREPVLLIIAYDLDKMNLKGFVKTLKFAREFSDQYHETVYCLTASSQKKIDSIVELTGAYDLEFCHTDESILKMMVRANPGIIILKNGVIIAKRSYNTLPKLKKKNYYMTKIKTD
jgi:hypothetical protein